MRNSIPRPTSGGTGLLGRALLAQPLENLGVEWLGVLCARAVWNLDPDSDAFQKVTHSAQRPPSLELGDSIDYSFELVVSRRHLGGQCIEMVGMTPFTLEQELTEVSDPEYWARLPNQPLDWHLRAYTWNPASGTWVASKEVTSNNAYFSRTSHVWEDWEELGVFAYRSYNEHLGQVRVCRPDTLQECRYNIHVEDAGLSMCEIERHVMFFYPRPDFRP